MFGELAHSKRLCNLGYCRCFWVKEFKCAISRMIKARAIGHDDIPIEFLKCTYKDGMEWSIGLFNAIFKMEKSLDQRRCSIIVPLYKNKSEIKKFNNYRGITTISHTIKVRE